MSEKANDELTSSLDLRAHYPRDRKALGMARATLHQARGASIERDWRTDIGPQELDKELRDPPTRIVNKTLGHARPEKHSFLPRGSVCQRSMSEKRIGGRGLADALLGDAGCTTCPKFALKILTGTRSFMAEKYIPIRLLRQRVNGKGMGSRENCRSLLMTTDLLKDIGG